MSEPHTDLAKFERLFREQYLEFKVGEWLGYHTLTIERGCLGFAKASDDCKVTLHFDADGSFVDMLVTCEKCEMEKESP